MDMDTITITSCTRKRLFLVSVILFSVFCRISFIPVADFSVTNAKHEDGDANAGSQCAIFYHAYINPEMVYHSLGIVYEQLAQWQASRHANVTLYYTHLGDTTIPFPCPGHSHCELLHQNLTGWEGDTLAKISEYCQEHPDHNVIYLHSKGSFHPHEDNNRLRKILTKSALSDQCHQGLSNTQCNACSARFSPLPHWHTPGNMWTAKCSYVEKLYPIRDFEARVTEIVVQQFGPEWKTKVPDWSVGAGRFANEHWVNTHHQVYPCDVYPDIQWFYGYMLLDVDLPLELLGKAPRNFTASTMHQFMMVNNVFRPPQIRLTYRLHELQQIYNAEPANDSFVWSWYQQADLL